MSFFKDTCPWCGAEYYTGIVGSTPVGNGHRCTKFVQCAEEGCQERSKFCVNTAENQQSWEPLLVCGDHRRDLPVVRMQPWAGD